MSDLITRDLVLEAIPSLTSTAADRVTAAAQAQLQRVAPCVADDMDMGAAEALGIVFQALQRTATPAWVASVTTGPYGAQFRAAAMSVTILNSADVAALQALCGATLPPGLPLGDFPPAPGLDPLFARNP